MQQKHIHDILQIYVLKKKHTFNLNAPKSILVNEEFNVDLEYLAILHLMVLS